MPAEFNPLRGGFCPDGLPPGFTSRLQWEEYHKAAAAAAALHYGPLGLHHRTASAPFSPTSFSG